MLITLYEANIYSVGYVPKAVDPQCSSRCKTVAHEPRMTSCEGSPLDGLREELRNQPLVVRLELLWVYRFVALAVKIVRVERANSSQRSLVFGVCQVLVSVLAMPSTRLL